MIWQNKHLDENNITYPEMNVLDSDISESKKPVLWVHIESYEEFMFLQPTIELFAEEEKYCILVTFSILSLEQFRLINACDCIDYLRTLPNGKCSNADSFISYVKPRFAIFSSTAIDYGYFFQLKNKNIPTYLITHKLCKTYRFFRWANASYGKVLKTFTHIFVFERESIAYLEKLGIGDTTHCRFLPFAAGAGDIKNWHNSTIERFVINNQFVFIGANVDTNRDMSLIADIVNNNPDLKCILVPQTISEERLNRIKYEIDGVTVLYSECDDRTKFSNVQVLVIDFLCGLQHISQYGSCAFIGGKGISTISEMFDAISCGLPILFESPIKNSILPKYLIEHKVSRLLKTHKDIRYWVQQLMSNPKLVRQIETETKLLVRKGCNTAYGIYAQINNYV